MGCAGTAAASNGRPISNPKNSIAAATDQARGTYTASGASEAGAGAAPRNPQPISAPTRIAPTWPIAEGTASARIAAATAIVARARSGQRLFAIPHTACATTATATIFNPCSQGAPDRSPNRVTP